MTMLLKISEEYMSDKEVGNSLVKATGGVGSSTNTNTGSQSSTGGKAWETTGKVGDRSYSGGSSYGTVYSYSSMKPKLAFITDELEFWGSSKSNLDDVNFSGKDLIINCTGLAYVSKPFVVTAPSWLSLKNFNPAPPNQLLLEWKDMGAPPGEFDLDFWSSIIEQATKNGIERIFCCCTAGQGRTGTALASLALAAGVVEEPDEAIDLIREYYTEKAVETKSQELYLWNLRYTDEEIFGDGNDSKKNLSRATDDSKEWEEWLENYVGDY